METLTALIDRYFDCFNETDTARRRALIARTWVEDGYFRDPLMEARGQAGIDAIIQGLQTQFPGYRLQRVGDVDSHTDRYLRFTWEMGREGEEPAAGGVDFGTVFEGRIESIIGFINFAPPGIVSKVL